MAEGAPQHNPMTKPKFLASQRAHAMNKAFVSILNGLISVRPLEASPNHIVLIGWSATPHGFFSVHTFSDSQFIT